MVKNVSSTFMNGRRPLIHKLDGTSDIDHALAVKHLTDLIVDFSPFDIETRKMLKHDTGMCALTHDKPGKDAINFQAVMYGERGSWYPKRHEILSACFAAKLPNTKEEQLLAISTTHRNIPSNASQTNEKTLPDEQIVYKGDNYKSPIFIEMVAELSENAEQSLVNWNKLCTYANREDLQLECFPVIDSIGLSYEWLSRTKQINIPKERRKYASVLRAILMSADHLASADVKNIPKPIKLNEFYGDKVLDTEDRKGDAILIAPQGIDRVEASLIWAGKNQIENGRLFYVSSRVASVNSIFLILRDIYGKENVGLLHHKTTSFFYKRQEELNDCDAKLESTLNSEIYYPIKVCTVQQLLRFAFRGHGWEQSLVEFTGACFIFDDIYIHDFRMLGLMFALVKFLKNYYNASILFTSSMMPKSLCNVITQCLPKPPEFIKLNSVDNEEKKYIFEVWDSNVIERLNKVIQLVSDMNTIIFCNTVATAQQVYNYIRESVKSVLLIHGKFAPCDSIAVEHKIINEKPQVIVTNQILEAGLQMDYNIVITEPAPIDVLARRFAWINKCENTGHIIIFENQYSIGDIYSSSIVTKTINCFKSLQHCVLSEVNLMSMLDSVYSECIYDDEVFNRMLNNPEINQFDEKIIAGTHRSWIKDAFKDTDQPIKVLPSFYYDEYVQLDNDGRHDEAEARLVFLKYSEYASLDKQGYILPARNNVKVPIVTAPYSKEMGLQL